MVRLVGLTFGAGNKRYNAAAYRFKAQLENLELFDEIIAITEKNLQEKEEFWLKHKNFIEKHKRGYGYWLWKPYIIMHQLENMSEGDIIFYADAGCEVDASKVDNFTLMKEYFLQEDSLPILARKHYGYKEEYYCKMDTFVAMEGDNVDVMKTPQYQATLMAFKNCQQSRDFARKWYDYCTQYHLLDDTPSNVDNVQKFKEHRHDQSIFSILYKKTFNNATPSVDIGDCVYILRTRNGGSNLNRVYRKC